MVGRLPLAIPSAARIRFFTDCSRPRALQSCPFQRSRWLSVSVSSAVLGARPQTRGRSATRVFDLETKLNRFSNAGQQLVERARLCVAATQICNSRYIVAFGVAFDNNVEFTSRIQNVFKNANLGYGEFALDQPTSGCQLPPFPRRNQGIFRTLNSLR